MNFEHYYFAAGFNSVPDELDLAVLFSGEGKPYPGHKMGPAVHDYYLIHTVLAGEGMFQCGNISQKCRTGDTFVIFPGALFSYQADDTLPWHYVWIALQGNSVAALLSDAGITKERPLLHAENVDELTSLYERTRQSFQQSPYPRLESLEASGWARLLLHKFGLSNLDVLPARPQEMPEMIDRQIDQAIRWISLQFHQQISIDQIAATLGYHRAHLSKAFKQRTGLSPKQYLLKMRMDKAKGLLEGTLSIDQVASSVGFNDALYFSKQFRKYFGIPPSEYRAALRSNN
ncbi:Arabinose operon regulatory protein [Paenibacillus auburnensis]|uniref:Arabinose operon regulatory protein n=1 Tax=Paenibacillus auburnensis TaxID=2905649 RepID=A0ABM9BRB5_9BACL|nr:AraC family transcriptional regulator [Paenibacillus auburnensis]CAH1192190.1 Arabinose operon regulatory protein [Paenibacillus auburnensis]